MISKYCVTAAVLWVSLFIHEARTEDDLQFWEPDPKFDTRRVIYRNRNHADVNKQKFTYNREKTTRHSSNEFLEPIVKPSFRAKAEFDQADDSRRVKFRARQTKGLADVPTPRTKKMRGKQKGRQGEDNDHIRHTTTWSVNKPAVTHDDMSSADSRSTRIVPDAEPQSHSKKWWWFSDSNNKTKGEDRYNLSPYSIAKQLEQITSKMPEANVTTEVLGRTAEYNDIVLLKVTEKKSDIDKYFRADDSKYIDDVPEKKIIFIVHALSVMGIDKMSVFKFNHYYSKLFSYYFAHLDKFDIFLIPMANPDGYAYAMNRVGSVIWNKNLSPQNGCAGVALDRNFDVAWNISKPISTCSQQYPGSTPFSEPETRAIRDVLHRYSHKIIAYMHLHSGTYDANSFKGDAILYPKGYSDAQSDDDKYIDLKGEIDECMKNASFKYLSVTVDTLHNWYGKVFGTSVDYASSVYGVPYAMELVMQIYSNLVPVDTEEDLENIALEQIWARVIDVVFKSIWKNIHMNDVQ